MRIVDLHTTPENTMIKNDETFLWVRDETGAVIADYDFCTGLRLIQRDEGLTIYVNDSDLVPGSWTLSVTTLDANAEPSLTTTWGTKDGVPAPRDLSSDNPWDGCAPGEHVSVVERDRRLSLCKSCPLLDSESLTCSVSGKPVFDTTTRVDQFCPEDLWGNKQDVLAVVAAQALADGSVAPRIGPAFESEEQAQFESELDQFLEGTA